MEYYTDGSTLRNGQPNQSAMVCAVNKEGNIMFYKHVGNKTNNEAELLAIALLCELIKDPKITIYSDSMLAVNLIIGAYKTKIHRLQGLINRIKETKKVLDIHWIPREANKAGWLF